MIETGVAAFKGAKVVKDALTRYRNLSDDIEVKQVVSDALDEVGKVQDQLLDMRERIQNLQEENAQLRQQRDNDTEWQERLAKLEMVTTEGGATVAMYKAPPKTMKGGIPTVSLAPSYVCPNCLNKQEVQPLQDDRNMSGTHSCPSCNAKYPINEKTPLPPRKPAGPFIV